MNYPTEYYFEDDDGTLYPVMDEGNPYPWHCCGGQDPYYFKDSVPKCEIKCKECMPERWHKRWHGEGMGDRMDVVYLPGEK